MIPKWPKVSDWTNLKFWESEECRLIDQFLEEEISKGKEIIPDKPGIMFRALSLTSFKETKIIILGQDPYYTKGVSDGLCFSTWPNYSHKEPYFPKKERYGKINKGRIFKIPPSLQMVFKEYVRDTGFPYPRSPDLTTWARNGVLLINAIWSVEQGKPKSHAKIYGKQLWQELTAEIIQKLNKKDKLVYLLWGNAAKEWRYLIDEKKHLVIPAVHPSPRNITQTGNNPPFIGGKYFTRACEYLDIPTKIWRLP